MIPVNEPDLSGNEEKYLVECIRSGWISSEGPYVKEFENRFAAWNDCSNGIAVSNGTAALDIAIEAVGIGPGDEVIMPSFTIISCVHQIVRAGAIPVLVDSEIDTWNMNVESIAAKVSERTKAILVVHIYGLPVDMDPVLEVAKVHNLAVIEDASEMLGQTYKGRKCGTLGTIGTFSFYPNKHITTGEGGMLVTDDADLAAQCRSLRNLCFQPNRRFVHERLGWNYRMTNMQAAIGVAQLERLEEFITKKRYIGSLYQELLADCEAVTLPLKSTDYAENIYWVFGLVLNESANTRVADLIDSLASNRIGCRRFFFPMHRQPVLQRMGLFIGEDYPVSDILSDNGVYLPSGLALTEEQIRTVSAVVLDALS